MLDEPTDLIDTKGLSGIFNFLDESDLNHPGPLGLYFKCTEVVLTIYFHSGRIQTQREWVFSMNKFQSTAQPANHKTLGKHQ